MDEKEPSEYILPNRMARRRLIAGRLALSVFLFNLLLALLAGWVLSGPAAGLTRFDLGFAGWALAFFVASNLLAIPIAGLLIMKLLQLPRE